MAKKKTTSQGNKYAHLSVPQAELDFHGQGTMTRDEIYARASDFIVEASHKGFRKVLIITGKGLHSANGPVIGPLLLDYLPSLPEVKSVVRARRDRGGEGALEVELHL